MRQEEKQSVTSQLFPDYLIRMEREREEMGILASKQRVKAKLSNSAELTSACDSAYNHCISLTQHSFNGVLPYQLPTAAAHIHTSLHHEHFISRWVPSPPTQAQIDSALRLVTNSAHKEEGELVLGHGLFKEWALVVFAEAVVAGAGKALLTRVPVGIAGIVGAGALTRSGREVVGAAVAVYALGVATSVYLTMSG